MESAAGSTLTTRLPETLALLDRGAVSYLHALTLAEAVYGLDEQATAAVQHRV
jgi:hypothetical protein